ncbi:MAG: zf-TFIIB domain-containing protein [bacterium]
MNCPSCKNPMVILELEDVEVDHCFSCGGIWLDAGELELLMGTSSEKECLLTLFETCEVTKEKSINCPICLKKMKKVLYGNEEKKIRLDKCVKNDGIWFDKGELNEVLKIGGTGKDNKIINLLKEMFAGTNK